MNNYIKIYSKSELFIKIQKMIKIMLEATNRLSSYHDICDIPEKGKILNLISIWWLNKTSIS